MSQYKFLHTGSYVKIILHDIPERPGVIARMSRILADHHINIMTLRHSAQSATKGDIAFTVAKEQADESFRLMKENLKEIGGGDVSIKRDLALVFIRGGEIEDLPGFVSDILRAFSEYHVEFDMLSLALEGVTCILPENQFNPATHAFNKMFIDEPIISPI